MRRKLVKFVAVATINVIVFANTFINATAGENIASANASKYAYSIGVNHGIVMPWSSNLSGDFTPQVDYACTAYGMINGMTSYKNHAPTVSYMRGNNPNNNRRIASDVVFLNGHGNYDNVCFNSGNKGGEYATGVIMGRDQKTSKGYSYAGIETTNMNSCDHISFVACNTASKADNITKKAVSKGANSALGFKKEIHVQNSDGRGWLDKYNDALANGYTIAGSVSYASNKYPDADPGDYAKIYGNSNNTISNNKSKNVNLERESQVYPMQDAGIIINADKIEDTIDSEIQNINGLNKIIDKIKKIDPSFDLKEYKVSINIFAPQDGNGMIKFKQVIDREINTNKAYIVNIEGNKVKDITCSQPVASSKDVNEKYISLEKKIISAVNRHKLCAVNDDSANEVQYHVVKEDGSYKYDFSTNELRYEKTIFYIVPNSDNAIAEYTIIQKIPF